MAKPVEWASLFAILNRLLEPSELDVTQRSLRTSWHHSRASADRSAANAGDLTRYTDVLELRKLEELAGLLGRSRLTGMLNSFVEALPTRLAEAESAGPQKLSAQMHALVSTSGELGFHELSALCAEIVQDARRGAGPERLADLRSAGERAIAAASRSGFAKVA